MTSVRKAKQRLSRWDRYVHRYGCNRYKVQAGKRFPVKEER